MKLDVPTIIVIASIVFATQTLAVFVQYKVNKTYKGLDWWLVGVVLQALGFSLMLALMIPSIYLLAVFANPLVLLGQIFLTIGIMRFLGKKYNRWVFIAFFLAYIVTYCFFIFVEPSIFWRSVIVSVSSAIVSMMTAYALLREKKRHFSGAADFTASVFLAFGCLQIAMAVVTCILPPLGSYRDLYQAPIRSIVFILPIAGSVLWTFGFIIMVNQRLNSENLEEREKLQMIFNMSPDAKLITRLSDDALVDVNAGFLAMTGYARDEIVGKSMRGADIWDDMGDRQSYLDELRGRRVVENKEASFRRKDGSRLVGMISGSIIRIDDQAHIVSVINDITEHKRAEQEIRDLLAEKELILKEVHHRIKNNMNTISSLLALQAGSLKDPASIAALEDAGSRVQSMMTLYDQLYKSADFTELSLRDYLPPLIERIVSNFPNADSVKVEMHIDDFILEIKQVQPLGILLNELVTNIMKYAFPGRNDGIIAVSATLADGRVTIAVRDNGVGIPESVDFGNSTGFGLMVVGALASQLKGTIWIERGEGTAVILEFEK
jgi:PAS domain S-box-containing protein